MTMRTITLLFTLMTCVGLQAQESNGDWEPLFNGKDLSGFIQYNGKALYQARDGMIVGTTVFGERNSFLATKELYGDFILELEVRLTGELNSGIQFRSEGGIPRKAADGKKEVDFVYGYQMEVDPSPRAWSGGIYDESRRGWLYPLEYNPAAKKAFKPKDWNHYRIECIGNTIRTWVNGTPCAYLVDDKTAKGFIALQVHSIGNKDEAGKEIHWKNIRINTKNLKPSPSDNIFVVNLIKNTISYEEMAQGYSLLWDGKTTAGWRGAQKDYFPDNIWSIVDGELIVGAGSGAESSNGGDIVTENEFSAFDLQFEFKLTDTANSGVKYYVTEREKNSGSAIGLEYQLLDDDKHPDAKAGSIGNRTLASLYDLIPAAPGLNPNAPRRDKLPIGEWNRGRIVSYPDGRVEHWLNGWKMVEYQRGTPIYNALVARSKYKQWENFGMAPKGRILLQEHGTKVSFRSIKIKEL